MKKELSAFLAGIMVFGSLLAGVANADTLKNPETVKSVTSKVNTNLSELNDVTEHWANQEIARWNKRGIIQGVENGNFEPERGLTRAEWVTLVNRLFQYQELKPTKFSDVKVNDWFSKDVQVATAAGYINGYEDSTFKPNAVLTRQEAAAMISRVLNLKADDQAPSFSDGNLIAPWARESISAVYQKGIIQGFQDESFQPTKAITRAEAMLLLDRAFTTYGNWYDEERTYGPESGKDELPGSVIINHAGAKLQNLDIAGDLIIGKQVGDGNIYLKNVTVHGKTYVYGGGEHSVHLEDSIILTVIINKVDGTVRLVATGSTSVKEITIQTSANIEAGKGTSINKLTLSNDLPEKSRVMINGSFDTVNVEAKSILVQIPQGNINQLNVSKGAEGTTLETSKESRILSLVLDAATKVLGSGSIDKATINSTGISMEQQPKNMAIGSNVPSDVKVNIGGNDKPASSSNNSPVGGGGSNNSGGGSTGGSDNSGNGGNTGGSNGKDKDGALEGGSWYYLGLASDTVTVGESVYVTSTRSGTFYLFQSGISPTDQVLLEAGVAAGTVRKTSIQAGVRTAMDTTGLPFNSFYGLVVFDSDHKPSSYRYVTVLDNQTKALNSEPSIVSVGADPQYLEFIYNRDIKIVEGKDLRTSVTVATYNQPFAPLSMDDDVKIVRNKIILTPKKPYGKKYKLAIATNTIQTLDGKYANKGYVTPYTLNSFGKVFMISPTYTYNMKIKIGTKIKFKSERDDSIYFVLDSTVGTEADFDKEANDHGKKIIVPKDGVDETYEIDTSSLNKGHYRLYPWTGISLYVELID
ncbi:S-layer homology domain-containing protein [Paenibacillus sp. SYP-B3998]|uniref:S-layer homology domain-containing protein n=1 Tax=Paenibacillus sp. SYP-B3998 TaxID=2678564 RepID=A0A6G4A2L8_9BACL|nr:S-layer homology domain-containing protein [Paenibacillus sp. SYP-B3998]NEW08538.1 S-layer homology domain-containing protein [Paenibacillus sp. SYP-B3998]